MSYKSLRATFLLFFVLGVGACGAPADEDGAGDTSVQVEDVRYSLLPGGARIVTGTLYNPTTAPIRNAQIQISLFDENNVRISTMSVTLKDIEAGARKPFREPVDSNLDVRGASVNSVVVL